MEGHHAHLLVDGRVQRGDVGIAEEDLRVRPDDIKIHLVQHARHAVAAPHAHHGVHPVVREHLVESPGAGSVAAREIAVLLPAAVRHDHLITQGVDGLHHLRIALLRVLQRPGHAHQADGIALFQGFWFKHMYHSFCFGGRDFLIGNSSLPKNVSSKVHNFLRCATPHIDSRDPAAQP